MLTKTTFNFNIKPIIDQVTEMAWYDRSISLNETAGTLLNGPYTIKPEFQNTPLGNVLASLGNIGEARLLKLDSGGVYTAHTDPDDRLHLSIISNEFCYLVNLEDNTLHHLPVDGYIWDMDTSIRHSAVNLGGKERIHLNIRKLLPAVTGDAYRITFDLGGFDWKQQLYLDTMGYVNRKIKDNTITGFERISDKEILVSVADKSVINYLSNTAKSNGIMVLIKQENR